MASRSTAGNLNGFKLNLHATTSESIFTSISSPRLFEYLKLVIHSCGVKERPSKSYTVGLRLPEAAPECQWMTVDRPPTEQCEHCGRDSE